MYCLLEDDYSCIECKILGDQCRDAKGSIHYVSVYLSLYLIVCSLSALWVRTLQCTVLTSNSYVYVTVSLQYGSMESNGVHNSAATLPALSPELTHTPLLVTQTHIHTRPLWTSNPGLRFGNRSWQKHSQACTVGIDHDRNTVRPALWE